MNIGSPSDSNTLTLIGEILAHEGDTFAAQAANHLKVIEARMSHVGQGSDHWHHLLRMKGQIAGFIRNDKYVFQEEANAIAA